MANPHKQYSFENEPLPDPVNPSLVVDSLEVNGILQLDDTKEPPDSVNINNGKLYKEQDNPSLFWKVGTHALPLGEFSAVLNDQIPPLDSVNITFGTLYKIADNTHVQWKVGTEEVQLLDSGPQPQSLNMNLHDIDNITQITATTADLQYIGSATTLGPIFNYTTTPTFGTELVPKAYVDSLIAGFHIVEPCYCGTTTPLSAIYNNGAGGVGATLTATSFGTLQLDTLFPPDTVRVLIKNQVDPIQNGIYTVQSTGSAGSLWILERATDYDSPAEMHSGTLCVVDYGPTLAHTIWLQTNTIVSVGISAVNWSQVYSASYTAGPGIDISGLVISTIINATNLKYTVGAIDTVQDISITSTPTFANAILNNLSANSIVGTNASKHFTTSTSTLSPTFANMTLTSALAVGTTLPTTPGYMSAIRLGLNSIPINSTIFSIGGTLLADQPSAYGMYFNTSLYGTSSNANIVQGYIGGNAVAGANLPYAAGQYIQSTVTPNTYTISNAYGAYITPIIQSGAGFTTNAYGAYINAPACGINSVALYCDNITIGVTPVGISNIGDFSCVTVRQGAWQGSTISAIYGGTGQSSYLVGDLLVANTTTTLTKLHPSPTAGWILTSNGTGAEPTWQAPPATGVSSAIGTQNQVLVNGVYGIGNAQTGAVTYTTPQNIGTTSLVQFGSGLFGTGSTTAANLIQTGPLIASEAVAKVVNLSGSITSYASSTSVSNLWLSSNIIASSTTLGSGAQLTIVPAANGIIQTITNLYGLHIQAGSGSGTITNAFGLHVSTPGMGTNRIALYADNASIGTTTPAPSNGLLVQGNIKNTVLSAISLIGTDASSQLTTTTSGISASLASLILGTPLVVSSGGTGTSTVFTQGSVIFAGASGIYTQNNLKFFWDNTNARLGLGTTAPLSTMHINNTQISTGSDIYGARIDGAMQAQSGAVSIATSLYANANFTGSISTITAGHGILIDTGLSAGTISTGYGLKINSISYGTARRSIHIDVPTNSSSTQSNALYISGLMSGINDVVDYQDVVFTPYSTGATLYHKRQLSTFNSGAGIIINSATGMSLEPSFIIPAGGSSINSATAMNIAPSVLINASSIGALTGINLQSISSLGGIVTQYTGLNINATSIAQTNYGIQSSGIYSGIGDIGVLLNNTFTPSNDAVSVYQFLANSLFNTGPSHAITNAYTMSLEPTFNIPNGGKNMTNAYGLNISLNTSIVQNSKTLTNAYGINIANNLISGSGTITNMYGVHVTPITKASGSVSIAYGGYFHQPTAGTINVALHADAITIGSGTSNTAAPTNGLLVEGDIKNNALSANSLIVTNGSQQLTTSSVVSATVSASLGSLSLVTGLSAASGGTGFSSFVVGDILYANTTTTLAKLSIGAEARVLTVSGGLPSWQPASALSVSSIQGTIDQIYANGLLTPQNGAVVMSLPQSIASTSTPQFAKLGLGLAATSTSLFITGVFIASSANSYAISHAGSITSYASSTSLSNMYLGSQIITAGSVLADASELTIKPNFAPSAGNNITRSYGIWIQSSTESGAGSIATAYGIYNTAPTIATNNYGYYQNGNFTGASDIGMRLNNNFTPSANSTVLVEALIDPVFTTDSNHDIGGAYALQVSPIFATSHNGATFTTHANAIHAQVTLQPNNNNIIASSAAVYATSTLTTSGTITSQYGIRVDPLSKTAGTVTTAQGIYIGIPSSGVINYGMRINGTSTGIQDIGLHTDVIFTPTLSATSLYMIQNQPIFNTGVGISITNAYANSIEPTFNIPAGSSNLTNAYALNISSIAALTTGTISSLYALNITNQLTTGGTITAMYGVHVNSMTKTAGNVVTAYGAYFHVPTAGTTNIAAYTDNLTVGSSINTTAAPSNGLLVQGNIKNNALSATSLVGTDASSQLTTSLSSISATLNTLTANYLYINSISGGLVCAPGALSSPNTYVSTLTGYTHLPTGGGVPWNATFGTTVPTISSSVGAAFYLDTYNNNQWYYSSNTQSTSGWRTSPFPLQSLPSIGIVTQTTSITTGVAQDTFTNRITTVSASIAAKGNAAFTVTNPSVLSASNTAIFCTTMYNAGQTGAPFAASGTIAAGSYPIILRNFSSGSALNAEVSLHTFIINGSAGQLVATGAITGGSNAACNSEVGILHGTMNTASNSVTLLTLTCDAVQSTSQFILVTLSYPTASAGMPIPVIYTSTASSDSSAGQIIIAVYNPSTSAINNSPTIYYWMNSPSATVKSVTMTTSTVYIHGMLGIITTQPLSTAAGSRSTSFTVVNSQITSSNSTIILTTGYASGSNGCPQAILESVSQAQFVFSIINISYPAIGAALNDSVRVYFKVINPQTPAQMVIDSI